MMAGTTIPAWVLLALYLSGAGIACGQEREQEYEETRARARAYILEHCQSASAEKYWLNHFRFGIQELDGSSEDVLRWHGNAIFACYETPRSALKQSEPLDGIPGPKTKGAVFALKDLIGLFGLSESAPPRITAITGLSFSAENELLEWWLENGSFLRWSEVEGRLVVDQQAKELGEPVIDLYPTEQFTPEDYWYRVARGQIIETGESDGLVRGRFMTGDVHRAVAPFEVPAYGLNDIEVKEKAYLRAARELIGVLERWPGEVFNDAEGRNFVEVQMDMLRRITRRHFDQPGTWVEWWRRCSEHLKLDPEGERLIGIGDCF